MEQTNTKPLRLALATNAAFSLTSGLMMVLLPSLIAGWLGVQAAWILQAIGIGLILFAADLIHQATRPRLATWRALYASAADFLWVLGSLVVVAVAGGTFSFLGATLILAVAAVVLLFGCWQLWAIGQAHRLPGSELFRHCIRVSVNRPADAMWTIIARFGDIQRHMPSLRHSSILDDRAPGVGAVRVCEDRGGKRWAEECVAFDAGRSFDVRFVAEAPDFPFPAKSMHGGWEVTPQGDGSEVTVWWELEPKRPLLAPLLLPLLAFQADRDFQGVIRSMAAAAHGGATEPREPEPSPVVVRLLPTLC